MGIIRLKGSEVSDMIVRHMSKSVSTTDRRGQLANLLTALESDVGLIISERIINMPPQIAVPLYQTLANEVKKARTKNLPFNFTHYAIISKVLVAPDPEMAIRELCIPMLKKRYLVPNVTLFLKPKRLMRNPGES